ncbi:unnamed protein product, partial [Mesorhabditis spiculigera]
MATASSQQLPAGIPAPQPLKLDALNGGLLPLLHGIQQPSPQQPINGQGLNSAQLIAALQHIQKAQQPAIPQQHPAPPLIGSTIPVALQQALQLQQIQQQQLQQNQLLAEIERQKLLQQTQRVDEQRRIQADNDLALQQLYARQRKASTSSDGSRISIPHHNSLISSPPINSPLRAPPLQPSGQQFDALRLAHTLLQQQQQFSAQPSSSNTLTNQGFLPPGAPAASTSASQPSRRLPDADDDEVVVVDGPSSNPPTQSGSNSSRNNRKRPQAEPDRPKIDHSRNILYKTTMQEHQKHLVNKGLVLNTHQSMVMRLRYIAEHVIRALNEFGWAVVDNFLGSEQCKFSYKEIERLYERGLFTAGQVADGKSRDGDHIRDIRSDYIYWFDGSDKRAEDAATVRLLVSMIDSVILHFNKRIPPYSIAGRSRAMIAIYPGNGTRYVKHVDNPAKDGRCITTIYYCNEGWDVQKDGGALRLYPETSEVPMDVDPKADRLVFFWSDRRNPHEVMPVYRHRFAITIWYMDKEERQEALERMQHPIGDNERTRAETSEGAEVEKKRPSPPDHYNDPVPADCRTAQGAAIQPSPLRPSRIDDVAADSGMEDNASVVSGSAIPTRLMARPNRVNSLAGSVAHDRIVEERSSVTSEEGNDVPMNHDINPEYVI